MSGRIASRLLAAALVSLACAWASRVHAMPADPNPFEARQPDGTRVTLHLRGDEWQHWVEDDRGFTVVQDGATWRYAAAGADGALEATIHAVGTIDPAALGLAPGLRAQLDERQTALRSGAAGVDRAARPADTTPTGVVRNLVVLCRFSDHTVAAQGRDPAAFDSLFNQVGSSGFNAPTGSVRDFYAQASYGLLTLQSTVTAWVALPQNEAYYGNGRNGLPFGATPSAYPNNAGRMVRDALDGVDAAVNFADFDQNNDGFVDAITFIHSGYGGEQGGNGSNSIWSHQTWLNTTNTGGAAWVSADKNANNVFVKVDLYHTEAARFGGNLTGSALTRVGVVAHELGHYFGLPDLYNTTGGGGATGIGNWCLMANSWGWDGDQRYPPLPSAWCRMKLGWAAPTTFFPTIALRQVASFPDIARIDYGYPFGEYLLIENRQPVGFDQRIPQGGLAVWHIDENVGGNTLEGFPGQPGWPGNGNHFKVELLQADGLYHLERRTNGGDAGDLYRSVPGVAMSEATTPDTDRYQGGLVWPTGNEISEVSASGSTMTLRFRPANWVDVNYVGTHTGSFVNPYSSLIQAIDFTSTEAMVICKPGFTTERPAFLRAMKIRSYDGTIVIGN